MGEHNVENYSDPHHLRLFTKHLLADLRALEQMLSDGTIESGVRRIGAEQEFVLVDASWRPASIGPEVLEKLSGSQFASELGRFNVEFNLLPPLTFEGDCLRRLEAQLTRAVEDLARVAETFGARPILTGILPTHCTSNLGLDNMVPRPRYLALAAAMKEMRGEAFECRFSGTDELIIRHDTVMLESANTSCQFHFQVGPEEFPRFYNAAQAVAGPVLAAAVNSPLLFGRRLWRESRIALLQQAVDTRRPGFQLEQRSARVSFGKQWVRKCISEIFRDDIARFRVIMGTEIDENPLEVLGRGGVPRLKALQLHNTTVYRWNRPCYGVCNGKPHLRIENRILPAGPTVVDQVANGAFWFGLIGGVLRKYDDITERMEFDTAKTNFMAAARMGLDTLLTWVDGKRMTAQELIYEHLVPLAEEGLTACGIAQGDIDRYLGIIAARVDSGKTGAQWQLDSYCALKGKHTMTERLSALTAAMWSRFRDGKPVHEWPIARMDEGEGWEQSYTRVEQYMTTDLFTVHEDEVVDLAACLMDWEHIRHVPVKNGDDRIVGLISARQLLRFLAHDKPHDLAHPIAAREVMQPDPITVAPETTTLEAVEIMRKHRISCLPVVKNGRVVGMVSERDFMRVSAELVEGRLRNGPADSGPPA